MSTETDLSGPRTWLGNDPARTPVERIQAKLDRLVDSDAVTVDKADVESVLAWHDAGVSAVLAFERLAEATTLSTQADAFVDLSNAMSDLKTFLPGYDYETGTIPAQREENR